MAVVSTATAVAFVSTTWAEEQIEEVKEEGTSEDNPATEDITTQETIETVETKKEEKEEKEELKGYKRVKKIKPNPHKNAAIIGKTAILNNGVTQRITANIAEIKPRIISAFFILLMF